MNKAKFKSYLLLCMIFSVVFLGGCSKDTITINIGSDPSGENGSSGSGSGSGNGGSTTGDSTKLGTVYFNADILSMITKASTSPISTNRYVTIYAYNGGSLAKSKMYVSKSAGTLTPVEAPDLSLNVGNYVLYAPGVNTANTQVPVFANGTYTQLTNNVDYIWWTKSVTVNASNQTVDMTLSHCCSQILIKLRSSGDTISSMASMTITPSSTSNSSWDLTTGIITPATSLGAPAPMGISNAGDSVYYGQITMLPLTLSSGDLEASFTISLNGGPARNYQATLPVYKSSSTATPAFTPGNCYIYDLLISQSGIIIGSVNVTNWVDVTVTNEPIIPSQI